MESRDPGGCGEILGQAILTSGSSRESRGQDHSGGEAMGRASSYGGLRGPCRGENQIKTEALGKAISGPSPGRWMGLEQRPSFVCVCVCVQRSMCHRTLFIPRVCVSSQAGRGQSAKGHEVGP